MYAHIMNMTNSFGYVIYTAKAIVSYTASHTT